MDVLDRECDVFCRYLIGQVPGEYIRSKYREFHHLAVAEKYLPARPFDEALLWVARWSPHATRLADGYARIAFPSAVLRKKLVLVLAILESSPYHQRITEVEAAGGARLWAGLVLSMAFSGCALLTSVVLFAPWHVLYNASGAARRWVTADLLPEEPDCGQAPTNPKASEEAPA